MFKVQYFLADGSEIDYQCTGDYPNLSDVDSIALLYAQKRSNCLPDTIFCSVRMYRDFISGMYASGPHYVPDVGLGTKPMLMQVQTAAGPLVVRCLPMASDAKLFMIGRYDDFERYDIDKIFEEIVLKDCEKV